MINVDIILREILLLVLSALGWFFCARRHTSVFQNSKEMITFPRSIALIFGSFRPDGALSYPALIFQVTTLLYTLIISLVNVGQLTFQEGYHYLTWPTIILGLVLIIFSLFRK